MSDSVLVWGFTVLFAAKRQSGGGASGGNVQGDSHVHFAWAYAYVARAVGVLTSHSTLCRTLRHRAEYNANGSQIIAFFVGLAASQLTKTVLQCQAVAYTDRVTNMLALKNRGFEMEGNSSQLETRVTRLETHMEHMDSNISRIMGELHDLRTSTEARFEAVYQKFDAVNEKFDQMNDRISMLHVTMIEKFGEINANMNAKFGEVNAKFGDVNAKFGEIKVWALTVLGGGVGFGILTVVARALHWI